MTYKKRSAVIKPFLFFFIARLASRERAVVAAACSSACVQLWAAMQKTVLALVLQLVIGGQLQTAVSFDLMTLQLVCLDVPSVLGSFTLCVDDLNI